MAAEMIVAVNETGAHERRLDELAVALRTELLALEVDDVTTPHMGQPPAGARSVDVAAVGALVAVMRSSVDWPRASSKPFCPGYTEDQSKRDLCASSSVITYSSCRRIRRAARPSHRQVP